MSEEPKKLTAQEQLRKASRETSKDEQVFILYQMLNNLIKERLAHEHTRRMAEYELSQAGASKEKRGQASANLTNANMFVTADDRDIKIAREVIEDVKSGKLVI